MCVKASLRYLYFNIGLPTRFSQNGQLRNRIFKIKVLIKPQPKPRL